MEIIESEAKRQLILLQEQRFLNQQIFKLFSVLKPKPIDTERVVAKQFESEVEKKFFAENGVSETICNKIFKGTSYKKLVIGIENHWDSERMDIFVSDQINREQLIVSSSNSDIHIFIEVALANDLDPKRTQETYSPYGNANISAERADAFAILETARTLAEKQNLIRQQIS